MATISEKIRARLNDAPLTTEYLLDEAADVIDALVAVFGRHWNGRYFTGISDSEADVINAALALARGEK